MDWINDHEADEDIDDPLVGVVMQPKDDRPLAVRKAEMEAKLKGAWEERTRDFGKSVGGGCSIQ